MLKRYWILETEWLNWLLFRDSIQTINHHLSRFLLSCKFTWTSPEVATSRINIREAQCFLVLRNHCVILAIVLQTILIVFRRSRSRAWTKGTTSCHQSPLLREVKTSANGSLSWNLTSCSKTWRLNTRLAIWWVRGTLPACIKLWASPQEQGSLSRL